VGAGADAASGFEPIVVDKKVPSCATSSTSATSRVPTCSHSRRPQPVDGPLNASSGRQRYVGDLVAVPHAAVYPDSRATVLTGEFGAGDGRYVFADARRAQRELGFRATEDFPKRVAEPAERMHVAA
jgi:hypothetical protein